MLLEMSMGASVMIVMGIIIRTFFSNHLPKFTFILIWGLVIIRLLVPISISMPNFLGQHQLEIPSQELIVDRIQVITDTDIRNVPIPIDFTVIEDEFTIEWLPLIWKSGILIGGGLFLSSHLKFRKQVADSLPVSYEFKKNIEIRETTKISSPLTYGIFRPVILMPKTMDWDKEEQVEAVLTHEYVHICSRDYLAKIVLAIVLCVHWFNPLVWVMYVLANRDIELACDEKVLKILGREKRSVYAMTLL